MVSHGSPSIRCPRKLTVPCAVGTSPEMHLSVVDFPAPLAPSRVTMAPSGTSRETRRRAWMLP